MYHDQGLIPFKSATGNGVNYTAGLSAVRTSPDHGVAFDIAGEGVADHFSFSEAIFYCVDMSGNEIRNGRANPIKSNAGVTAKLVMTEE